MPTLLASLSPYCSANVPAMPVLEPRGWQARLVREEGVVLADGKVSEQKTLRALSLDELCVVHALADAINTESAWRIERVFRKFQLNATILEPLLAALNLELAVTGQKKKFGVMENGTFKARTFSGGVVFQFAFGSK